MRGLPFPAATCHDSAMRIAAASLFAASLAVACTPAPSSAPPASSPAAHTASSPAPANAATPVQGGGAPAPLAPRAEIGKPAPDFTLKDTDGKAVALHDLRGKTVVLEWFNAECPFVKMSHTKGSLVGAAKRSMDKGVAWLAISSSAAGKQGSGVDANVAGKKRYDMPNPILLDDAGDVGHAYGAANTPHMFVVDAQGVLVYKGAVDNSPDGEGESPTGGKLVSYVDAALADLAAGRPVAVPETRAYGCSVKYAK